MHSFVDVLELVDGVHLPDLPPFTTLFVCTMNTLYRVVVTDGCNVFVQGGAIFPHPTSAHVEGARLGGGQLMVGWIGVGLLVEFRTSDNFIVTSPVRAITTEQARPIVH